MYTICMVGTGYVGLVTGACLADFGNRVLCVDVDAQRVQTLQSGRVPFFEPLLEDLVQRNTEAGRLSFGTDLVSAVRQSQVIFIAVGTPDRGDGHADMSYLFKVIEDVAPHVHDYKVMVTKSTVPVGTGRRVQQMLRDLLPADVTVDVASNPEFLREGSAIEDFMRPNRVVIGAETAELIKYASNAFLATKISYANEIAAVCERVGADIRVVAKAMGLDQRIGSKFLHAGIGYGGSCFPKDTEALLKIAEHVGLDVRIVRAAVEVNRDLPRHAVAKLKRLVGGELQGKTICLLGLAFKPNTDDVREAPALKLLGLLRREGAHVRAFDPVAMERVRAQNLEITLCGNAYEAMQGCDALMLVTEWNEFRTLDLQRVRQTLRQPVFVDCRNMYERERMQELGFQYDCYGA